MIKANERMKNEIKEFKKFVEFNENVYPNEDNIDRTINVVDISSK